MSVPLSRRRADARRLTAESNRGFDAARRQQRQEAADAHRAAIEARRAAREVDAARPRLTRDDLAGAAYVRTADGWRRVVRVSAASVTVETPWSWTERVPHDRVLETRPAADDDQEDPR